MNTLAVVIVVLSGLWLIGLGTAAFAKPDCVKHFFDKFASSAFTHFLEMFVRIVVGKFLVERLKYWRDWATHGESGIVNAADRE